MVEKVLPDLFRIEIPLPENPLKSINSYVITSKDRNLIIDTGLNRKECLDAMHSGLQDLGIDLSKTDFFITHLHADHLGLISKLASDKSTIYFNRPDKQYIDTGEGWESMFKCATINGFPESDLRKAFHNHPGYKYKSERIPEMTFLGDGDRIEVGDYSFKCVLTPGHTQGHTCLYEPRKKIFVSGDHILGDITPNIQCWSNHENPLKHYLASLDRVYTLDVDLVLPGHRRLFRNFQERIEELKRHHRQRINEILAILGKSRKNSFQIASEMTWNIECESWNQFPVMQKWFATGEAIAHLRYLAEEERVLSKTSVDAIWYSLNPRTLRPEGSGSGSP